MELKIRTLNVDSNELKGVSENIDTIIETAEVASSLFFQTDPEIDYVVLNDEIEWHIDEFIHLNKNLVSNRQRAAGIVLTSALFPKFDWTTLEVEEKHKATAENSVFYIADNNDIIREDQYIGWVSKRLKDFGGIKPFLTTTTYDINAIEPWRIYAIDECGLSMGYDISDQLSTGLYTSFAVWYVTIYKAPLTPVKLVEYSANYDDIIPKREIISYNGDFFEFVFYKSK